MAVTFDASNDIINCGSGASLDDITAQGNSGMTLSAWINATSVGEGGTGDIISKANTYSTDGEWVFYTFTGNRLGFYRVCTGDDLDIQTADNAIALAAWKHVLLTWTGSLTATTLHIYVNGAEVSYAFQTNGTTSIGSDAAFSFSIGNNVATTETFDGGITEVAVWNVVLSAAQIAALYGNGSPKKGLPTAILPSNLMGYWPLNDFLNTVTVTTAADLSGNTNTGTPAGSPVALTEPLMYKRALHAGVG